VRILSAAKPAEMIHEAAVLMEVWRLRRGPGADLPWPPDPLEAVKEAALAVPNARSICDRSPAQTGLG